MFFFKAKVVYSSLNILNIIILKSSFSKILSFKKFHLKFMFHLLILLVVLTVDLGLLNVGVLFWFLLLFTSFSPCVLNLTTLHFVSSWRPGTLSPESGHVMEF